MNLHKSNFGGPYFNYGNSQIIYGDPWLIIELHDYVFPFWHAILRPVLTITKNKMRKNETQLMNEQKMDI